MLINEALAKQLAETFSSMEQILLDYQLFSVKRIRDLDSQIIADALLSAISDNAFVTVDGGDLSKQSYEFVDNGLEEAYARVLILLAHLKQEKSGKASRLWANLTTAYKTLLGYLNDLQLLVALFQFAKAPILVTDRRSWFFREGTKELFLVKGIFKDYNQLINGPSNKSAFAIARDMFLPAYKNFKAGDQKNIFDFEAAFRFCQYTGTAFYVLQYYVCGVPQSFDKTKRIGSGAFGEVSIVTMKTPNETITFAAKSFYTKCTKRQVQNEINISRRVRHAHVVKVLPEWLMSMGGRIKLAMEYCANGDLDQYFRNYPQLSDSKKIALARGVLSGLQYLHGKGIVHLDISSNNIVVTGRHKPKICDFGLSVSYSKEGEVHELPVGNPDYFPPDFCRVVLEKYQEDVARNPNIRFDFYAYPEKRDFDAACLRDIFAFMVVLWRIFVNDSVYLEVLNQLEDGAFEGKDLKNDEIKQDFNSALYHEVTVRLEDNAYLKYAQDCEKEVVVKPMVTKFFGRYSRGVVASLDNIQSELATCTRRQ